eukprot:CAMPEP_0204056908 /NCGR_PEP_ID=MMETSP0360-20130528/133177_1 /ASSEMBLY_ACC=CAM_ASM_000342 /TAXON_ID=268821 /ORGANISM="Scrippsiella Hangoei, Strain SHTV-5" /LENGTH=53 /DNA_ID=CAMNT_0051004351 /DNA_START=1 /DNA_END=159 /DNA_ORIENTATION=+
MGVSPLGRGQLPCQAPRASKKGRRPPHQNTINQRDAPPTHCARGREHKPKTCG